MAYVLDGAVILVVILMILWGYRRGFARSIVQLVGCLVALAVSFAASGPLAEGVFDRFMADKLQASVQTTVEESLSAGAFTVPEALSTALESLPATVRNVLGLYELDTADKILQADPDGWEPSAASLASRLVTNVVRPVTVSLLRMACFLALFLLLLVVVSILAALVGRVFHLPVLRQIDGVLGAVVGAVQGVILAFALVTVLTLIASTGDSSNNSDSKLTRQTIDQTAIVSRMVECNPVTALLDEVV